ncbi:helix-turn-helix domain-containing protein [Peribacillus butanolivorans]|uniref:helix-turn-helix domain-containing protein n=1 Tax=Peribacillus butanolivorans TaxID=421767 RepID=UPI00207CF685|nr:helix-turn-helix domain-containing protein [Peribacillus butanolivorans]MCO0600727.1 helix-turn-helix domain-containing protein [Peribacillus butanolivorans]
MMIGLEYIVKEFQMEFKEVANRLGISPQTMQDWLKKRRKIPAKRLEQLSNMFNFPEAFFQKELNFTEKGEVAIRYLERISKEEEIPVFTDEGEITHYYKRGTYEDEIQFLKETMEKKKKQNDIRKSFEVLMKYDALLTNDDSNSDEEIEPLLSDSSNTETLNKIIKVMQSDKLSNEFKVMVHLLNINDELGGKPTLMISPEYREFAGDFLELLKKHKIKN